MGIEGQQLHFACIPEPPPTEPFRPSNATESDDFMSEYCDCCCYFNDDPDSDADCPIFIRTLFYDVDSPDYPKEWIVLNGQPTCTGYFPR